MRQKTIVFTFFVAAMWLFFQACEPRGANRDTIENDNSYEMMEGEDIPPAEEYDTDTTGESTLDSADISEMQMLQENGDRYRKVLDSIAQANPRISYTYVPSQNGPIKTVLGDYRVEVDNTETRDEKESIAEILAKRFDDRQRMLAYYNELNNVDMPPTPEGGYPEFYEELQRNLNYPEGVEELIVEGLLFVQVDIEKNGTLSNIEIAENINTQDDDLEEAIANAAINAIKKTQTSWIPAQNNGRPVRSKVELPVWLSTSANPS